MKSFAQKKQSSSTKLPNLQKKRRVRKRDIILSIVALIAFWIFVVIVKIQAANGQFTCSSSAPDTSKVQIDQNLQQKIEEASKDIPQFRRAEETSFLSFPEYYIVYSAVEYAQHLKYSRASTFPYFSAIAQYWQSYRCIQTYTSGKYPYNSDSYLMLKVIGGSFTAENAFKGMHERFMGGLIDWFSGHPKTPEDLYIQKAAEEYAQFLFSVPWYEFDYWSKFKGLWSQNPFFGSHFLKKIERKLFFSIEYAGKTVYAKLIRAASHSVYDPVELTIYLVVKNVPKNIESTEPRIKIIKKLDNQHTLISVQRYQEFNEIIPKLAQQKVQFVTISGNSRIMVSVVTPKEWKVPDGVVQLFEMGVLIDPDRKRVGIDVPISQLSSFLQRIQQDKVTLERMYDY